MWLNDLLLKVFTSAQDTAVVDVKIGKEMKILKVFRWKLMKSKLIFTKVVTWIVVDAKKKQFLRKKGKTNDKWRRSL